MATGKNESKWTYVQGPSEQNMLWGTFAISSYVLIWVSSLVAPIAAVLCFVAGLYKVGVALFAIIGLAYIPWPRSKTLAWFYLNGFKKFFRESSLLYEVSLWRLRSA